SHLGVPSSSHFPRGLSSYSLATRPDLRPEESLRGSGKEVASPSPSPLRTARAKIHFRKGYRRWGLYATKFNTPPPLGHCSARRVRSEPAILEHANRPATAWKNIATVLTGE